MPPTKQPKLPSDYIDEARIPLTLERFKQRFRENLSAEERRFVPEDKLEQLFEIASDFLKKSIGIEDMKREKVRQDLGSCKKLLSKVFKQLQPIIPSLKKATKQGRPVTTHYAEFILAQLNPLCTTINLEWFPQLQIEGRRASFLQTKGLNYQLADDVARWTHKLRLPLDKQKKNKKNGKRNHLINRLVHAARIAALQGLPTGVKRIDSQRVRSMRYHASKALQSPVEISEMEKLTRAEQRYFAGLRGKKQKGRRRKQK